MKIGIPVYDQVNLLDVAGPVEMFTWVPKSKGLKFFIVSEDGNPVMTVNGVGVEAHGSFNDHPDFDVLWVPGGQPSTLAEMMSTSESVYTRYLKQIAESAKWVCSVCEGALLAAHAGILDGHKITTHWNFVKCFDNGKFPNIEVVPGNPRYVLSGNRLTGGGISSGLDQSLKLIELLFGNEAALTVQRVTQYFPDPPVMGELPEARECPIDW